MLALRSPMPVVVADSLAGLIREEHYVLVGRWAASMYSRTRGFDESLRGFSLPLALTTTLSCSMGKPKRLLSTNKAVRECLRQGPCYSHCDCLVSSLLLVTWSPQTLPTLAVALFFTLCFFSLLFLYRFDSFCFKILEILQYIWNIWWNILLFLVLLDFFSVACHFKGYREKKDVNVGTLPNRFGFWGSPRKSVLWNVTVK